MKPSKRIKTWKMKVTAQMGTPMEGVRVKNTIIAGENRKVGRDTGIGNRMPSSLGKKDKKLDERETRRACKRREQRFASGHPLAPYNTTQFSNGTNTHQGVTMKEGCKATKTYKGVIKAPIVPWTLMVPVVRATIPQMMRTSSLKRTSAKPTRHFTLRDCRT